MNQAAEKSGGKTNPGAGTRGLIPVTILTGFLGAGKTTLLNRILAESHGHRIAVIENEFGPESVDNDLLVRDADEQIVEMNNGCVCCTVRGDLARILGELQQKRAAGKIAFDRVVIETTGMANPGPVTQTFFVDEEVGSHYRIDGVITVVDAKHGHDTLDRQSEAQNQVGFADRLLLSKTDLVDPEETRSLRERLVRMNPRAPIRNVHMGRDPRGRDLRHRRFRPRCGAGHRPAVPGRRASRRGARPRAAGANTVTAMIAITGRVHDHDHEHGHHHHVHDDAIQAFVFRAERPFDARRLEETLSALDPGLRTRPASV